MDLKGILNEGPAGGDSRKVLPEAQRDVRPPILGPLATNGQPPTPYAQGRHSTQQTPLYPPPSASPVRQPYPQGQTPVQTPIHSAGGGQYPFPQHPAQSPAGAPPYRSYDGSATAAAPFARTPSHGYQYPPSATPQQSMTGLRGQSTSSLSPTPPSSHSPYVLRHSPSSARSQAPHLSFPPQQHQYAQPTTPLGPPPLYQRPPGSADAQSPFHQRRFSTTLNGVISGSPAQYHSGGGYYAESPSAYVRPPSQQRQPSDYHTHVTRERSESVSPKTKVPPKPPSLGSRHSSEQEGYAQREAATHPSLGSAVNTNVHVTQHQHPHPQAQAQAHAAHQFVGERPDLAVSQTTQHSPYKETPHLPAANPMSDNSLSQANFQRPPLVHHSSSKMGMSHLLMSPVNEASHAINGTPAAQTGVTESMGTPVKQSDDFVKPRSKKSKSASTPPTAMENHSAPSEQQLHADSASVKQEDSQPAVTESRAALKRPADSEIADEPPSKQRKTRKYTQRPIWAQLSKHNPKYSEQGAQNGVPVSETPPQRRNDGSTQQQSAPPVTNGVAPDQRPPWLQHPPLDNDLIHVRNVLGRWEKTFRWNTPYPDVLKAVQDWLYVELDQLGDVGRDPQQGTVEIEAKFGTLMRDADRYQVPVMNACVIHPEMNGKLHFESNMTEHLHMNQTLNEALKTTLQPGRIRMEYTHLREVDSFHTLSAEGQKLLPQSLQRRQGTRKPRLRTTRTFNKDGTSTITAHIVKISISNLHIFNPGWNYDCRISINLEVNLDRPDLSLEDLIVEDPQQPREVDRKKDRIAYKHLAYSIDLTKVDRQGLEPSHELELEVDSNVLREQMAAMKEGRPHAFGDVVSSFIDNATFLMRTRPPAAQQQQQQA